MTDQFQSSDANRNGTPLRHAQTVSFDGPLTLTRGGELPRVTLTYETWGELNDAADNAVLICHALSGDSHVARHDADDDPGWWDLMVGPGKPIDTDRYFVICSNVLGGCRGSTGPNTTDPRTDKPYGADFPLVTIEDMVDMQKKLIDHLGIKQLHGVTGGSLGGQQALCWATRYPESVRNAAVLASAAALTAQALAFDIIGRNAITRDPNFNDGQYYDDPEGGPAVGLALARMLGHITYLSPAAMSQKFDDDRFEPREVLTQFEREFSVGSYLAYQGDRFVERFDANSYVTLSMAMDQFQMARDKEGLREVLGNTSCRWLVVSFTSDWLFPASQSRELVEALIKEDRPVSYCNVESDAGHDAFLLEDSLDRYGGLVRALLDGGGQAPEAEPATPIKTSIFDQHRIDHDLILDLIEPGASVLDVGCGRGELLNRLAERGHDRLMGMEIDEYLVLAATLGGHHVLHADLNKGLPFFLDKQFDYVLLSQTLQTIVHTQAMTDEILRVGKKCLVSFPNFAYHKIRTALAEDGRSPGSEGGVLHYDWYNTPNRRFLSIRDWQEFCDDRNINIHRAVYLDMEADRQIGEDEEPNKYADTAIFVVSREG
ncbi:MAG: homoserine O-acetyltransferase [Phycisphaeraceae bacterium]|nr:homoserine O-acetyltransferase [Phycisphaeraceae bacterium]